MMWRCGSWTWGAARSTPPRPLYTMFLSLRLDAPGKYAGMAAFVSPDGEPISAWDMEEISRNGEAVALWKFRLLGYIKTSLVPSFESFVQDMHRETTTAGPQASVSQEPDDPAGDRISLRDTDASDREPSASGTAAAETRCYSWLLEEAAKGGPPPEPKAQMRESAVSRVWRFCAWVSRVWDRVIAEPAIWNGARRAVASKSQRCNDWLSRFPYQYAYRFPR